MRQQHDRRVVGHLPERRAEIINTDARHPSETPRRHVGQLIAKPGEPERVSILGQTPSIVFINRNAGRFERAPGDDRSPAFPLHGLVVPPIVIAENRMHAERGLQAGEHRRPFIGWNEAGNVPNAGDVIPEQDDHVRIERIGAFDDGRNALKRHPGIAGMDVGDGGNLELEISWPLRRLDIVPGHA